MPIFDDAFPLRPCLLPSLSEHEMAADLLSAAVDALLGSDLELARARLREADMPALFEFASKLMGPMDPDIHRRRYVARGGIAVTKATTRMPSASQTAALYRRDGWRCRFCGCRVVSSRARDLLRVSLPGTIPWSKDEGYHGAFFAFTASVDHVLPHSAGGSNELDNLVTACCGCQFGRGGCTLDEFGLSDPRLRQPVIDAWDGLTRVLAGAAAALRSEIPDTPRNALTATTGAELLTTQPMPPRVFSSKQAAWLATLDAIEPTPSRRLIDFLDSCADLGVSWSLNKVLLARMTVTGKSVEFMGVEPDGTAHIPWQLIDMKDAFRVFAERLAVAIPGAATYETAKWWVVAKPNKKRLNILEVLRDTIALRAALETLHAAMKPPD